MTKVAIYRAIFGGYDRNLEDHVLVPEVDYYIFSDQSLTGFSQYKRVNVTVTETPALTNRELKLKVPDILQGYDVVMYLDGNIQICRNIMPLINKFLDSNKDFGFFKHPYSSNLKEEINSILLAQKARNDLIKRELSYLNGLNLYEQPRSLTDNSILIRKNFAKWEELSAEWLQCVKTFSGRDQLSLPFLRAKYNTNEYIFPWSPRDRSNKYFVVYPHNATNNGSISRISWQSLRYSYKVIESYLKRIF